MAGPELILDGSHAVVITRILEHKGKGVASSRLSLYAPWPRADPRIPLVQPELKYKIEWDGNWDATWEPAACCELRAVPLPSCPCAADARANSGCEDVLLAYWSTKSKSQ